MGQIGIAGGAAILLALVAVLWALARRARNKRQAAHAVSPTASDGAPPPAHFQFHFCPLCRSDLEARHVSGRIRLACTNSDCRFVHWDNPKPVVIAVVRYRGGIVLVRRKFPPRPGCWCMPGGFIEPGETPEQACLREVEEETSLKVRIVRFVGAVPCESVNELIFVFETEAVEGVPAPGDDADRAEPFGPGALPEPMAFEQHKRIVEASFAGTLDASILGCSRNPSLE